MRLAIHVMTVCLAAGQISLAAQVPPTTPPPQTPAQPAPQPPKTSAPPRTTPTTGGTTLAIEVTDRSGNGVGDVRVSSGGPVDRNGNTAKDGSIAFRAMRAGTYRLRFEHPDFITFEREVVVQGVRPSSVSVALTAAPRQPEPVAPPPQAPAATPPPKPTRPVDPRSLSIPDFLDTNLIGGGEPQKITMLACAEGGTARLLQVREPLNDQQSGDADVMLYVVAGSGILRIRNQDTKAGPGFFALVPRGMPYSIRRDGRNPVILVSVLAGSACPDLK
jgi:hypothetical protein